MSLATTIEADWQTVKTDVSAWAGVAGSFLEGLGLKMLLAAKTVILSLTPALLVEFQSLVVSALKDVTSGDLADIETAVVTMASADLKAALASFGSQWVQALIVIVQQL